MPTNGASPRYAVDGGEDVDEHLLRRLLGVGPVAEPAVDEVVDALEVPVVQDFERGLVALSHAVDEHVVRIQALICRVPVPPSFIPRIPSSQPRTLPAADPDSRLSNMGCGPRMGTACQKMSPGDDFRQRFGGPDGEISAVRARHARSGAALLELVELLRREREVALTEAAAERPPHRTPAGARPLGRIPASGSLVGQTGSSSTDSLRPVLDAAIDGRAGRHRSRRLWTASRVSASKRG